MEFAATDKKLTWMESANTEKGKGTLAFLAVLAE
jgi:hypothetical protein